MPDIDMLANTAAPEALAGKAERHRHLLPLFAADSPPLPEAAWEPLDAAVALDRARGCLLGLAVGEAIGSQVEYLARDEFDAVTGMSGGGPLALEPGEWTDGMAMALCLGQSLIASQTVEQYDFMRRLQGWLTEGENTTRGRSLAVGATTRDAIESFIDNDQPAAGPVDGGSAGNGSLSRLAPLAIFFAGRASLARFMSSKQSRATHGTMECLDACELFTAQLVDALAGADKSLALRPRVMHLAPNALAINGGEYRSRPRDEIEAGAYVIDTLEAALWCVWNARDFREAVLLAANLGGDPAGVAAVAGQLAGALYGASGIPPEWLQALAWREQIDQLAVDLARAGAAQAQP